MNPRMDRVEPSGLVPVRQEPRQPPAFRFQISLFDWSETAVLTPDPIILFDDAFLDSGSLFQTNEL